jgi:hypothetical protein
VPAATETLDISGITAVLLLVITTAAPPAGAFPDNVTVAVGLVPPTIVVGVRFSEATEGNGAKATNSSHVFWLGAEYAWNDVTLASVSSVI